MKTKPLPVKVRPPTAMTPEAAMSGLPIAPLTRIRHFSPAEWEDFVVEWTDAIKPAYGLVEKHAGSGDMGCDVVAFVSSKKKDPWDNYQCKHYDKALAPSDIWIELAKLAHYSLEGEYSLPRTYTFVAPRGAGVLLSKLLKKPDDLRAGLVAAWKTSCEAKITTTKRIPLDQPLKAHISAMDFSIFNAATPHALIKQHQTTCWYVHRFGGGLPVRPAAAAPPLAHAPLESTYIRALLDAYGDHLGSALTSVAALSANHLVTHLERARREFYSAEALKEFSRDNVPPGTFDDLLGDVHSGITDVLDEGHQDAYARVLAVVKHAKTLALTSNVLVMRTNTSDRGGMCHQLANESKVAWRR